MRQHLGHHGLAQAPDPSLVLVGGGGLSHGDLRSVFEAYLKDLKAKAAAAQTEADLERLASAVAIEFAVFQRADLWRTQEEAAKDNARVQAILNARLAQLRGFLGLSTTTWVLIAVGVGAGWYFWKKSSRPMAGYRPLGGFCGIRGCR